MPAKALEEFYVAMFALMLQASQANSKEKFEDVIANVRNLRDAWKQISTESATQLQASAFISQTDARVNIPGETAGVTSWTA